MSNTTPTHPSPSGKNTATGGETDETPIQYLVPDGLNDEPYETARLDLAAFASACGPFTGRADKDGHRIETPGGAAYRISAPSPHLLRLRFDPAGRVADPTTTETLGLLDVGADAAPVAEESPCAVTAGGFTFRMDARSGDFGVARGGAPLLQTRGGGVRFSTEDADYGGFRSYAEFDLEPDERFWGFGGRIHPFCRRGDSVDVFSVKGGKTYGDYSGFPVPFFISSKGYGVFLNNPWPHVYFDMGRTCDDRWWVATPGGEFDLFVIHGPTPGEIVRRFTAMVGRIPFPEKSWLGFWISSLRFESAEELAAVAKRLREERWPCDYLVLDGPWRGGPEFIPHYRQYRRYMNNDLEWHPDFGDGPGMIRELHADGFKIALHLNSRIFTEATAEEGLAKGLLRRREEEVVPRVGDPEGERFFLDHLRPRIDEGVDLWWTDHSDRVSGEIAPGIPSRNLFGPLWNRLLAQAMDDAGKGSAPSLSRGGGIGSQTCVIPWPGDTAAGLDRFAEDIWFCLGAGLAGFPLASVDIGGFAEPPGDPTEAEIEEAIFGRENLHRRLFQSIFFVPVPRVHNNYSSLARLPWNCPAESRPLYKAFLEARYRLTPLFHSLAIHAHRTGEPILRPLFYHFGDDPATHGVTDVFTIGDSLLLAPVTTPGAETRRFYCPRGVWYDLWSGERIEGGGEIERPCPINLLDGLPALVRAGSILPLQTVTPHLSPEPPERLDLVLYPDDEGNAALELHETEAITHNLAVRHAAPASGGTITLENATAAPRTYAVFRGEDGVLATPDTPDAPSGLRPRSPSAEFPLAPHANTSENPINL